MPDIVTPDGPVATTQGATVYVKRYGDFSRFVWGGECVFVGDIADERGGLNVTTRANALEGGLRRDGVLVDPPGNVTTTLSMKRLRGDKLKSRLRNCFWLFDKRTQCNNFDDPEGWTEIERVYRAKVGTRTTTPGTAISDANAEDMINFDITALEDFDLYRLHIEEAAPAIGNSSFLVKCVDVCHGERCVACGDPETDAVFVAGTTDDGSGSSPYVLVNEAGGDPGEWSQNEIAEWAGFDVDGITCLGAWGAAVSNDAESVIVSRDRFTTHVVANDTIFAAGPPNAIDASSQAFCVIVGDLGYIYISRDGLATLEIAVAGTVGAGVNLTGVRIAPSNRLVIYAWSNAADTIVKSENGGETWFALTVEDSAGNPIAGTGITALGVHPDDENIVLVGTDAGEVWETLDGGESWAEQADIPGMVAKADAVVTDIETAGGGVWFMSVNEDSDGDQYARVYVNYEDGANGAWNYYNPVDGTLYETEPIIAALAVSDPNRCVAVGGDGAAAAMVALLS